MYLPRAGQSFLAPPVSSIRPRYLVTVPSRADVELLGAPPAYGTTWPVPPLWSQGLTPAVALTAGWGLYGLMATAPLWGFGLPLHGLRW